LIEPEGRINASSLDAPDEGLTRTQCAAGALDWVRQTGNARFWRFH
jgi:hypothetical protein